MLALLGIPQEWIDRSLPILEKVGGAVLLLVLVAIVYRLAKRGLNTLEKRQSVSRHIVAVLRPLMRWTAIVVAILVVLQWFGLLGNIWTLISAVLAMVAIGFVAVWSVLSNTLCSMMLLITRPFQIGDQITLVGSNVGGKVVNFNLFFTTLRGEEGELVQIPNNTFFQTPIVRKLGKATMELDEQLTKDENTE